MLETTGHGNQISNNTLQIIHLQFIANVLSNRTSNTVCSGCYNF